MFLILCIFLIASFFELLHLFKIKEKKEAVIHIVISALAVALGVYMLLMPDFSSFSKILLGIAGINK
jgi:hypothetical protein